MLILIMHNSEERGITRDASKILSQPTLWSRPNDSQRRRTLVQNKKNEKRTNSISGCLQYDKIAKDKVLPGLSIFFFVCIVFNRISVYCSKPLLQIRKLHAACLSDRWVLLSSQTVWKTLLEWSSVIILLMACCVANSTQKSIADSEWLQVIIHIPSAQLCWTWWEWKVF